MLTLWNRPLNPEPGWWQLKYILFFTPNYLGKMMSILTYAYFQRGWFQPPTSIYREDYRCTMNTKWGWIWTENPSFFSLTRNSIFLKLNASPRNQNLPPTTIYLLEMEFISQFKASMNLGWIFWTRFLRQVSWWRPTWDWREWKRWTMSKSISMTRLSPVCTVFYILWYNVIHDDLMHTNERYYPIVIQSSIFPLFCEEFLCLWCATCSSFVWRYVAIDLEWSWWYKMLVLEP